MEHVIEKKYGGCRSCHINCGVECTLVDGRVDKVEAVGPEQNGLGKICLRSMAAKQLEYNPSRVRYPLKRVGKRGEGKWVRISWDKAIKEIAEKTNNLIEKYGGETFVQSGQTGRHDMNWLNHRWARVLNSPNRGYGPIQVCLLPQFHGAVQFGSQITQPCGTTPAELRVYCGVERAYGHPPAGGFEYMIGKQAEAKTIVFDPVAGPFALKADVWCPTRPGTDLAWAMFLIRELIERQGYDWNYVREWTNAPFLIRNDTGDLLRESDLFYGGSEHRYMFWDEASDQLKWWDEQEIQWEGGESGKAHYSECVNRFYEGKTTTENSPALLPEGMVPELFGTHDVPIRNGQATIACKTVFQQLFENCYSYDAKRTSEITWVPEEKLDLVAQMVAEAKTVDFMEALEYMSTNTSQYLNAVAILKMMKGMVDTEVAQTMAFYPITPVGLPSEYEVSYIDGLSIEQKRKRLGYYEHRLGCGHAYETWSKWHPIRPEEVDANLNFPDVGCVLKAIETGEPYEVHGMYSICSNWLMHDPSTARWIRVLEDESKIQLHVTFEIVMTPTAELSDYVLPAQFWMERNYMMWGRTGTDPTVTFFRKVVDPICEAKHDYDICALIAKELEKYHPEYNYGILNSGDVLYYGGEEGKFFDADTIDEQRDIWCRQFLGKSLEECFEAYKVMPLGEEGLPQKTGRRFVTGKFPTDTGKCNMFSTLHYGSGYPALPVYTEPYESPYSQPEVAKEYPLVLSTGKRQAGMFHSEFRNLPWMREINPTPEVFMNPMTAEEYGVSQGDWVWVESPATGGRAPLNKIMGRVSFRLLALPGFVSYSQHEWWRPEKDADDGLHGGLEWNAEALLECVNGDPELGTPGLRSQLCKVYKCSDADIEKYQPMITREQLEGLMPVSFDDGEVA